MKRYLRLYLSFLKFSLTNKLQFQFDFALKIIMDAVFYLVNFGVYKTIYAHAPSFGGLTEHQAMIFVGTFITVDALYMCFFSANMWFLPQHINSGGLDFYLLRPVNSQFFLSFREFAWDSFVNFAMAFGFLSYQMLSLDDLVVWKVPIYFMALICGTYLNYLIQMLFLIPAFWTGSPRGFSSLNWTLQEFNEKPDRIFRGPLRFALLTILPFSLLASVPVRVLFESNPWSLLFHVMGITILFHVFIKWFWSKGLKVYASASS